MRKAIQAWMQRRSMRQVLRDRLALEQRHREAFEHAEGRRLFDQRLHRLMRSAA